MYVLVVIVLGLVAFIYVFLCLYLQIGSGGNRVVRFPKGKERLDSLVLLFV
jgi:hypothetical protein